MKSQAKQFFKWLIIINAIVFGLFFFGGAALVVPTCTYNCDELASSFGQIYGQIFLGGNAIALIYYLMSVRKKA